MKQADNNISLFSLFLCFAKIGLFTFGGGYAMLPLLEKECVDKNNWITREKILDIYAIGQCTPGIIAVNTATYVGYEKRGIAGSVFATLGIVFPSIVIILLIATFLQNFNENIYIIKAFKGIRIAVCGLMTASLVKLAKKAIKSITSVVIAICSLAVEIAFEISPVFLVLSIIVFSLVVFCSKKTEPDK